MSTTTDPVVSDVAPLDVSRFPDSCAFEGAAPVTSYAVGRAQAEGRNEWRCPWLWAGIAAGALIAAAFCVAYPMGFAPLLP